MERIFTGAEVKENDIKKWQQTEESYERCWSEEYNIRCFCVVSVLLRGSLKNNCIKITWMMTRHLHFCQAPRVILESDLHLRGSWIPSQWENMIRVHLTLHSLFPSCGLASIYTTPQLVFDAPLWKEVGIIPSVPTQLLCMDLESTVFRNLVPIKQGW